MRQNVLFVLGVLVVGSFLLPEVLFAQTALQEIIRFDIPVNGKLNRDTDIERGIYGVYLCKITSGKQSAISRFCIVK